MLYNFFTNLRLQKYKLFVHIRNFATRKNPPEESFPLFVRVIHQLANIETEMFPFFILKGKEDALFPCQELTNYSLCFRYTKRWCRLPFPPSVRHNA